VEVNLMRALAKQQAEVRSLGALSLVRVKALSSLSVCGWAHLCQVLLKVRQENAVLREQAARRQRIAAQQAASVCSPERERVRERRTHAHTHAHTYICIYTLINPHAQGSDASAATAVASLSAEEAMHVYLDACVAHTALLQRYTELLSRVQALQVGLGLCSVGE
jgi:hypothetical protein